MAIVALLITTFNQCIPIVLNQISNVLMISQISQMITLIVKSKSRKEKIILITLIIAAPIIHTALYLNPPQQQSQRGKNNIIIN